MKIDRRPAPSSRAVAAACLALALLGCGGLQSGAHPDATIADADIVHESSLSDVVVVDRRPGESGATYDATIDDGGIVQDSAPSDVNVDGWLGEGGTYCRNSCTATGFVCPRAAPCTMIHWDPCTESECCPPDATPSGCFIGELVDAADEASGLDAGSTLVRAIAM
jgi:hypothetical protein